MSSEVERRREFKDSEQSRFDDYCWQYHTQHGHCSVVVQDISHYNDRSCDD